MLTKFASSVEFALDDSSTMVR